MQRARNAAACLGLATDAEVGLSSSHLLKETKVYKCSHEAEGIAYLTNFLSDHELNEINRLEQKRALDPKGGYYASRTSLFKSNILRVHQYGRRGPTGIYAELDGRISRLFRNGTAPRRIVRTNMLQFTRYRPSTGLNQLHHDRWTTDRFATVLIFLETPRVGGHTVFPAIKPGSQDELHPAGASLQKYWPPTGSESTPRAIFFPGSEPYDNAARMCTAAAQTDVLQGSSYTHFTIAPVAGDAVVFWHWAHRPQGFVPEWQHYHGGCGVGEGEKLAMQAFMQVCAMPFLDPNDTHILGCNHACSCHTVLSFPEWQVKGISDAYHARFVDDNARRSRCKYNAKRNHSVECGGQPVRRPVGLSWDDLFRISGGRRAAGRWEGPVA